MIRQLRQRRLVQIIVSYGAAGWIVLEVFDQFVDRGVLPDLAYYQALVWYVVGLLVAGAVGWYHGEKGDQKVTRPEITLLGLIVVCGLALSGFVWQRTVTRDAGGVASLTGTELEATRVAVLYFSDASQDRSLGYLVDGLTEALIDELADVPSLSVVSRNGSLRFKDSDVPKDSIARFLGAGTIVSGSVEDAGPAVRVSVALNDGISGAEFRRNTFLVPAADVFGVQESLAEEVSRILREWLGEEVRLRRTEQGTRNVQAWALLQRGERARKSGEEFLASGNPEAVARSFEEADSLLAEAGSLDPAWSRPLVIRAEIATRWAQLEARDPPTAAAWVEKGTGLAERALSMDGRNAEAFQARGILSYLAWRLGLATDPAEIESLLAKAQEDLETAVRLDPTLANAWNVLSQVHSQKPDLVEAKLAARRAYEEDAFLRAAENVLWSLYATSYDLEQFQDAVQYCDEGARRFPDNPRFTECELWLLASRALEPDPDRAWWIQEKLDEMAPPRSAAYEHTKGRILVGGVLARSGMLDSAEAVWVGSRAGMDVDPAQELLGLEAVFRLQQGQEEEAMRLIKIYLTTSPEHRAGWRWSAHWWWRDLQDNPEFRQLVGGGG